MIKTKALVETSLLAALAAAFYLAGHVLPIVGIALTFACPAPLVVLGLRQSPGRALLGASVASLLVAMVIGLAGALFFLLGFGLLGIGIGGLARRWETSTEILLFGLLISVIGKLALMGAMTWLTGVNPFSVSPNEVRVVMEGVLAQFGGGGVTAEIRQQMEMTLRILPLLMPALLVMAAMIDCYLSYYVGSIVLRRLGGAQLPKLLPFGAWRFPKSLLWAFLASFIFLWLGSKENTAGVLYQAGLNLQVLLSMLFFLQGSSVGMAFLQSRGVGKWRWGLFALVFLVPFLFQVALLVGAFDIWLDLRGRFGFMPKTPDE